MTQKILLLFLSVMISLSASAQVGINTTMPDASAALDVTSTDKGLLIPRVALASAIGDPAEGLMVYQTTAPKGFYYFNGTGWTLIGSDNLGNHTATTNLNMSSQDIIAVDSIGAAKAKIGPNTYPTTAGANGQVLTTNGAGALSWGSSSGVQVVLHATQTTAQTINTGVSVTNGTGCLFYDNVIQAPPSSIGSYTHFPTTGTSCALIGVGPPACNWTTTNTFTCNQSGYYLITATVLSSQTLTNSSALVPIIVVSSETALKTQIFGTAITSANAFYSSNRGRGHVSQVIPLDTGDKVSIFVSNSSALVNAAVVTTDNSTSLTIVKLL